MSGMCADAYGFVLNELTNKYLNLHLPELSTGWRPRGQEEGPARPGAAESASESAALEPVSSVPAGDLRFAHRLLRHVWRPTRNPLGTLPGHGLVPVMWAP